MRRVLCGGLLLFGAVAPVSAQYDLLHGGYSNEDESRFLPGLYNYRKGSELFGKGDVKQAIEQWTVAASWAMKEAQYNLGIAYYKGEGIAADRPLGLAWLAVAAERRNPEFSESLAAAWVDSSEDEHRRANEIYARLLRRYGDQVALVRAKRHFNQELMQIAGSRVGLPGRVLIWTPAHGTYDVAIYRRELKALSEWNFDALPKGHVSVGDLQIPPATDEE